MRSFWSDKEPTYTIEEDYSDPVGYIKIKSDEDIILSANGIKDLIDVLNMFYKRLT